METSESKTWELHVTINCCDGCKKKVKRKLSSINGVSDVTLKPEINKVSVTGNVRLETLIKNLNKMSKRAKPWPGHRDEYSTTKPATADAKEGKPEDGAIKELSVLSLAGDVAKAFGYAVGFLGQQTQGSKDRDTCCKLSPEEGPSHGTKIETERVGLELNLFGFKISYEKDVSYESLQQQQQ